MQIDAVEQRPADFRQIPLNRAAGAAAFPRRIPEEPSGPLCSLLTTSR
jgi:hypothetical protein